MVVVSDLLKNGNFVQLLQPKIPWCWHVGVISLQNVPLECKGIKKQKERTSNKSSLPFPLLTFHIQLPLCVSFGVRPNHMFWEVTNKMHRKKKNTAKGFIPYLQHSSMFYLYRSFCFRFRIRFKGNLQKKYCFLFPSISLKQKSWNTSTNLPRIQLTGLIYGPPRSPRRCDFKHIKKSTFRRQKSPKRRKRRSCCMGMDQKKISHMSYHGNLHF